MTDAQGIAALMALNSLELEEGLESAGWGGAEHMHAAIESMRLGFVDALQYNADPEVIIDLSHTPGGWEILLRFLGMFFCPHVCRNIRFYIVKISRK